MKKAVEGKTRVDLAVEQIIQVILDRDMKAGDKLPNEYDLARELGVGRSTLREAIKRLVARNILTARQGAGTFVSEKNGRAGRPARTDVYDGRGLGESRARPAGYPIDA